MLVTKKYALKELHKLFIIELVLLREYLKAIKRIIKWTVSYSTNNYLNILFTLNIFS